MALLSAAIISVVAKKPNQTRQNEPCTNKLKDTVTQNARDINN